MARTSSTRNKKKQQLAANEDEEEEQNVPQQIKSKHSAYKPGSIKRVKLRNFLTYNEVEFSPGARMNVVVGPNGTGKSTILCAICLGLGGQPTVLGRADDARTFIMHEKSIGEIEIELAPHVEAQDYSSMDRDIASIASAKKHVFRRVIDRNKGAATGRGYGSSTFYINGAQVNIKVVQKVVSEVYSISIENLCTFLPQDKVGSFSGFSPKMLLEETCKALSKSQDLYTDLQELMTLEGELKSEVSTVTNIEERLRTLQADNAQLEREKERMEERKEAELLYHTLSQKRAWLAFDDARQRAVEFKDQRDSARKRLQESQVEFEPLEQAKSNYTKKLERIKSQSSKDKANLTKCQSSYEINIRTSEEFQDKMEEEHLAFRDLDTKQRQAEKNVTDQQAKLTKFTNDLAENPDITEVQQSVTKYKQAVTEKKREVHKARINVSTLVETQKSLAEEQRVIQSKLDRMQDEKARRKERFFQQNQKLAQTYDWLEKNRSMFRRQVWGPVACEVTVKSPDVAACLEQHVSQQIWKMYVVECQEDYDVLFQELRIKLKLPVNIQIIPRGELQHIQRSQPTSKFQTLKAQHGVAGYLDELFTAPDPILQALRTQSNVHSVIVGSAETQNSIDRHKLLDFLSQREDGRLMNYCIFTSSHGKYYKYTSTISRYSGKPSLRVDDVNAARILAPGIPLEQKTLLLDKQKDINVRAESLQPELQSSQREQDELYKQIQDITQLLKEQQETLGTISNLKFRITNAKKKLEEYEAEASKDLFAEKEASRKRLKKFLVSSIDALETAAEFHEKHMQVTGKLAGVKMSEDGYLAKVQQLTDELNEKKQTLSDLENSIQTITFQFNESKKAMRSLKIEAEHIAPLEDAEGNNLPLKDQLDQLAPSNVQEVRVAMEEAQLKMNSITDNPELLRQYEARKKEIEEMEEELNNLKDSKNTRKHLTDLLERWEARMWNILNGKGGINDKFAEYMSELGCAGEVKLSKKTSKPTKQSKPNSSSESSEYNFKDWGIEMLVRFRETTQLSVLSAQAHSGGERSVGTIMYLMALQDIMVSPFRCVDEINQGLDDRNERLVFRRIVANATSKPINEGGTDHSGQYFLITPKLLPNLTDMEHEDVTVLCIFNGFWNFKHHNDWNSKILKKRLRDDEEDAVVGSDDEVL